MGRSFRRSGPRPAGPAGEPVPGLPSREPANSFTGRTSRPGSRSRSRRVAARCELAGELLHRPDEPAGVDSPARRATPEKTYPSELAKGGFGGVDSLRPWGVLHSIVYL